MAEPKFSVERPGVGPLGCVLFFVAVALASAIVAFTQGKASLSDLFNLGGAVVVLGLLWFAVRRVDRVRPSRMTEGECPEVLAYRDGSNPVIE